MRVAVVGGVLKRFRTFESTLSLEVTTVDHAFACNKKTYTYKTVLAK